jgi:hypothetical protein
MRGDALGNIGLAEDVPGNSLDALIGPGDAGDFGFHEFNPSLFVQLLPGVHSLA